MKIRFFWLVVLVLLAAIAVQAQEEMEAPRVALTSPTQPSYVQTVYGPVHYGEEFGLPMTIDDFQYFDSHATATQTVLAGQADIIGGSLVSHFLIREAGEDFKVFCPFVSQDDFVLSGRNGVETIEQLLDPETRVGVDSPGGAGDIILNAILEANGVDATVADLPNAIVLESSGLRTTSWAADQLDATIIHLPQHNQAVEEGGITDAVIISALYEDVPVFVKEAYAAPADWLEENLDVATAFCASVLKAARELSADFDLYVEAVNEFVGEPPDEEALEEVWTLISEHDFWSQESGLSPEGITFMGEMAVRAGVLEEVPDAEEVLDTRAMEAALEMLEEEE